MSTGPEEGLDPLQVLGLPVGADEPAIRAAYRAAVQAHPPERDPAGFRRVRAAFEALRDPLARAATLLSRPLLPDVDALATLGLPGPPAPTLEALLADLRAALLYGTDLTRREFPEDLREPAGGDG